MAKIVGKIYHIRKYENIHKSDSQEDHNDDDKEADIDTRRIDLSQLKGS
jgi:hypothetical protein